MGQYNAYAQGPLTIADVSPVKGAQACLQQIPEQLSTYTVFLGSHTADHDQATWQSSKRLTVTPHVCRRPRFGAQMVGANEMHLRGYHLILMSCSQAVYWVHADPAACICSASPRIGAAFACICNTPADTVQGKTALQTVSKQSTAVCCLAPLRMSATAVWEYIRCFMMK